MQWVFYFICCVKHLLSIWLLYCSASYAQNTVSMSAAYTRTDFFHGVEYARTIHPVDVFAGIEYGIVRSVFQSRFFPKVKAGFFYAALDKEKFRLGPVVQYAYSYLRYSKVPHGAANYHEATIGLRWRYGKKWQIGQTFFAGGLWERGMNVVYQKPVTAGTWGYVIQIECVYAF